MVSGLLIATLLSPARADGGAVAVHIEDDVMLPVIVAVKARSDLEQALGSGPLTLLDADAVRQRLEGEDMPPCSDDDDCWRAVAQRVGLARLLVVEVFADGDADAAVVRVVEPLQPEGAAPRYDAVLPRGGGFPIELAVELAQLPLYAPPAAPEPEPRRGFLARLFRR